MIFKNYLKGINCPKVKQGTKNRTLIIGHLTTIISPEFKQKSSIN
jgi:hypothetical protein